MPIPAYTTHTDKSTCTISANDSFDTYLAIFGAVSMAIAAYGKQWVELEADKRKLPPDDPHNQVLNKLQHFYKSDAETIKTAWQKMTGDDLQGMIDTSFDFHSYQLRYQAAYAKFTDQ